ncbi:MAG: glutathione S-transferase family protein [Gammaproteobacteria bacterium]|nr:glutathione S-transferase family protein [Gammaproteobacteria bacterium]
MTSSTIASKILYGSIVSPYVRKVAIILDLKKIDYTLEVLIPFIEKDKKKILDMNPLGKVPVYQEGSFMLSDSSAICGYLERQYPGSLIYPTTAEHYAKCLWYEEYADSQLMPNILTVAFNTLFAAKFNLIPDMDAVQSALDNKLPQIFTYLDKEIENKKYFVNDQLSLADISIAVSFLNFEMAGHLVDTQQWNNLSRYVDEISNEPVIAKSNMLMRERFKAASTK